MAIDPSIALQAAPAPNPLKSMAEALQVKNLQNQTTMGDMQLAQTQAINAAMRNNLDPNTGMPNYGGMAQELSQKGFGSAVPGMMKQAFEMQQEQGKAKQLQLQNAQAQAQQMGQVLGSLATKPNLTRSDLAATAQQAMRDGLLDQQHYADAISQIQSLPEDPAVLQGWAKQQVMRNQSVQDQLKRLLPQTSTTTVGGQVVPVTTTQATGEVKVGPAVASTPTSDVGKIQEDLKNGLITKDQADLAMKKATHIAPNMALISMGAANDQNFDATKPLSPAMEAQAKAIADGAPMLTPSSRNPFAFKVNARAQQLYADSNGGDATGFGTLKGTMNEGRKSFAPGGSNMKTVAALDTAVQHLDTLGKLGQALQNGDNQTVNKIGNAVAQWSGGAAPTNFDMARKIAMDEVAKTVSGANLTEADKNSLEATVSNASSPAQLAGAIETAKELMAGKIHALQPQYQSVYGTNRNIMERVSPHTRDVMTRVMGGNSGASVQTKVNPANGKTYYLHPDGNYYLAPPQ